MGCQMALSVSYIRVLCCFLFPMSHSILLYVFHLSRISFFPSHLFAAILNFFLVLHIHDGALLQMLPPFYIIALFCVSLIYNCSLSDECHIRFCAYGIDSNNSCRTCVWSFLPFLSSKCIRSALCIGK